MARDLFTTATPPVLPPNPPNDYFGAAAYAPPMSSSAPPFPTAAPGGQQQPYGAPAMPLGLDEKHPYVPADAPAYAPPAPYTTTASPAPHDAQAPFAAAPHHQSSYPQPSAAHTQLYDTQLAASAGQYAGAPHGSFPSPTEPAHQYQPQQPQEQYKEQPAHQAPTASQPAPVAPMQVRGGGMGESGGAGTKEWSHGLCDCFGDCGTCCLAWWCPCIVYGQNKTRLDYLALHNGQPHPEGGDSCGGDTWIHCLLTSCLAAGWIMQIGSREKVRQRYGIKGSLGGDCCAAFCCAPCELTQESRELEREERHYGGGALAGQ